MAVVATGSDTLCESGFSSLRGLRIGFVGNHTSRLVCGTATHIALHAAPNVHLVRLFSPEHGAFGREDREGLADEGDPATGITIHSLYGAARKPTTAMLSGLEALVFELQDVGARFYTYSSTMLLCLEAAHEARIPLFVLDRPNPITGSVEGPVADGDRLSFTACHPMPVRHGLTVGELARLVAAERGLSDSLRVIPCAGWKRSMWWDETGLAWIQPSPAMKSVSTASVYPGVCLLEQTNVSVGRGSGEPFLTVGAPWIDASRWSALVEQTAGPGASVRPHTFVPSSSKFEGEECHGLRIEILDRDALCCVTLGIALIAGLRDLHPDSFDIECVDKLLVSRSTMATLIKGRPPDEIVADWEDELGIWRERVAPHLLYD